MRSILATSFFLGLSSVAVAEPAAPGEKLNWDFTCVDRDKLADVSVTAADVTINNLSVREKAAFGPKGLKEAEVTYSIVNRGNSTTHLEGQFLLADESNLPLVAVVAEPDFGRVYAESTGLAKGSTLIRVNELKRVSIVCLRFVVGF